MLFLYAKAEELISGLISRARDIEGKRALARERRARSTKGAMEWV